MKLIVEVELGNDAMQTAGDAANAIAVSVKGPAGIFNWWFLHHGDCASIYDIDGNTVGHWEVTE